MGNRNLSSEILEIKERDPRGNGQLSLFHFQSLQAQWKKASRSLHSPPDFYLIRAVTILEVATRKEIALLIDHSEEFTGRAIEFAKNLKMDFAIVRDIQGRAITLGEIVAHSLPINSFGQILDHFGALFGKPIRPLLSVAIDRWRVEIDGEKPTPIIEDFDELAKKLTRLFQIRHILCHELPEESIYSVADVSGFIDSAMAFSNALSWTLTFEKFGLVPLTQTDMNISQAEKLRAAEKDLENVFAGIRKRMVDLDRSTSFSDGKESGWISSYDEAQEKWLTYRNAHCDFVTYLNKGGTIRPLLWGAEAVGLTEARTRQLRAWFEVESKQLAFEGGLDD